MAYIPYLCGDAAPRRFACVVCCGWITSHLRSRCTFGFMAQARWINDLRKAGLNTSEERLAVVAQASLAISLRVFAGCGPRVTPFAGQAARYCRRMKLNSLPKRSTGRAVVRGAGVGRGKWYGIRLTCLLPR